MGWKVCNTFQPLFSFVFFRFLRSKRQNYYIIFFSNDVTFAFFYYLRIESRTF